MYNEPMLKENALREKTIIITGGGTGLGKSIGKYCCELGANLVIASRKMDVLQKTAAEFRQQTKAQVLPLKCDVRNYDEVENMVKTAIDKFGKVDALLNNAAGNFVMPTERLSSRAFDAVIDIVLKGTCNCSLALGKYWIKNKLPGVMLNIVTTYAFTGSAYVVPSAAAKGVCSHSPVLLQQSGAEKTFVLMQLLRDHFLLKAPGQDYFHPLFSSKWIR